ncbi:MAG: HD-GYP domain-containing protein, partial [Lachnospiraceae bacterium]|nr:HD-GYP domain-containing protein [Lachnospiraceae bacterium]
ELDIDNNIVAAALMHHERCDGTGYPSRLNDGQINKYAKFISIIDAYEAMTSARTYRESLIPFQVIENFEKTSHFYSSIILNQVLQHIANSQLGSTVRLSDETLAEVILINQKQLSRPLVKCGDQVLDLSQYPDIKIVAVL